MKKDLMTFSYLLFLFFLFLSFLVAVNFFVSLDLQFIIKIQELLGEGVIPFFSLFSLFGTVESASIILLILLAITIKTKRIYVLILYALTGVIELVGKYFIDQNGPPAVFLKTQKLLAVPSDFIPHEFFSYPSGHATRAAFISGILLFIVWRSNLPRELKLTFAFFILTFDFVMFLSRVYLGEHWLTDVIGGSLLGFSLAFISSQFLNFKTSKK